MWLCSGTHSESKPRCSSSMARVAGWMPAAGFMDRYPNFTGRTVGAPAGVIAQGSGARWGRDGVRRRRPARSRVGPRRGHVAATVRAPRRSVVPGGDGADAVLVDGGSPPGGGSSRRCYRSNVKYRPRWDPRFICFQTGFAVNRGVIAAGVAEGFIPGPAPVGHRLRADDELAAAVRAIDAAPPVWTALTHTPRGQALVRHRKLEVLAANGVAAYPVSVPRTTSVADVRKHHARPRSRRGDRGGRVGRRADRAPARPRWGCASPSSARTAPTSRSCVARDVLGPAAADLWGATVDRGDQVSVTGEVVTSRTGELSVQATAWTMASKCLRPVPVDRPGAALAADRNLELTLDPAAQQALHARGSVLAALRSELVGRGFLEVETPMLQAVHGGANARPFVTHINAYDLDLYLRIAPELFLKRLAVSGVGRVFELNRNFRNEGVDGTHNPEFTVARGVRGARRLRRDAAPDAGPRAGRRGRRPRTADRPPARRWSARPRRRVAGGDRARRRRRGDRAADRSVDGRRGAAGGLHRGRGRRPVRGIGRRARAAPVRRPRRAGDDDADVLHRLPARRLAARPTPPRRSPPRRALGPRGLRHGARDGVLRADRPDRSAGRGSRRSRSTPPPAIPRRWRSTRSSSPPSSSACRPPAASASASTACSC